MYFLVITEKCRVNSGRIYYDVGGIWGEIFYIDVCFSAQLATRSVKNPPRSRKFNSNCELIVPPFVSRPWSVSEKAESKE